ncbi:MAG: polymer-forming cytoskeletal protein [Patescibacteria group bacterium]
MESNIDTIIGLNVVLKGSLKNKGSIEINGTIEGEVHSDEHINIGETAKVSGPVSARTVEVSGEVKGIIQATEQLEIHTTGHVSGDINAKSLIIQQGAMFVGKSIMPQDGKEVEIAKPAKEKEEGETKEPEKADKTEPVAAHRDPLGFFKK